MLCAAIAVARQQKLTRAELLYGVLVGVPNFFCSRLLLRSLSFVPASIAYPPYSVGVIVIVAVAGVVLFREEMNRRQRTAIGAILIALVLLNR